MPRTSRLIEASSGCIRTPFTLLVDRQEKTPWTFTGLRARSFIDPEQREYIPQLVVRTLGIGMGDYSIDRYEGHVAIERKSMTDFQGTLLGWPIDVSDPRVVAEWDSRRSADRRGRFKRELANLARMESAAVVVEASLGECLENAPEWGKRTASENAKYLLATFLAWQQEFHVPWIFCDDRRLAEIAAFRLLEKFWHQTEKERRQQAREHVASGLFR